MTKPASRLSDLNACPLPGHGTNSRSIPMPALPVWASTLTCAWQRVKTLSTTRAWRN